ncbi:MAG TPA: hypothetical protein DDZ41_11610 [Flavobacterium sp.]|nr:hypothetical protein [Flavobacterium sp.]
MKQLEKMSFTSAKSKLTRNEMSNIMAGSGDYGGNCKKSCEPCRFNSECCSGFSVSGFYPPCGGDYGRVCI